MEKLSSVLKLINELFKNDKSAWGTGQGETSWVAAGLGAMGPSPRLGWREGAEDTAAPVPSLCLFGGGFLLFPRRKIIENYGILCLKEANKIFL